MRKQIYFTGVIILLAVINSCNSQNDNTILSGPYLGQKPPAMKAELFDPGIYPIDEFQYCSGFLNDGAVFVFTSLKPGGDRRQLPIYITQLKNGRWTEPEAAPFSEFRPYNFTIGPWGKTLYFTSLKSPDKTSGMSHEQSNIWIVSLQKNGWTEPVMLGSSINTEEYYETYPSAALNGTIYFMSDREGGCGMEDIYRSKKIAGSYGPSENLGPVINTEGRDQDPFIAPDESYLIICQEKPEGFGKYDLYITFMKEDGSWTEPVNMGPDINTAEYDFRPYVTPDGKYLFFTSTGESSGNIYWVDAGIIETMKPSDIR